MYLQGVITIDPSQLTHLHRVKPTKGFAKLAHILSGGLLTEKEEHETFCAIAILQQINGVMRSLGIDNVIRLSKDQVVIFEDVEGKADDLKHAIEEFRTAAKAEDTRLFDTIDLILEHHTRDLTYLIDIGIDRTHRVGEHPIHIIINALPRELAGVSGGIQKRLNKIFASQETYDAFIARHQQLFTTFLDDLASAFRKHMSVDDVVVDSSVKIVRPPSRIKQPSDIPRTSDHVHDPVFHAYPGFGDAFFFAWLWSDLCHSNDIQCHDCTIVDSSGADVLFVGEEGFQAGEGTTMNVDEAFVLPGSTDVQFSENHEYSAEIQNDSAWRFGTGDTGSSGWLGSFGDSFSGDSGGGGDAGGCGGGGCGGGGCGGCGGG